MPMVISAPRELVGGQPRPRSTCRSRTSTSRRRSSTSPAPSPARPTTAGLPHARRALAGAAARGQGESAWPGDRALVVELDRGKSPVEADGRACDYTGVRTTSGDPDRAPRRDRSRGRRRLRPPARVRAVRPRRRPVPAAELSLHRHRLRAEPARDRPLPPRLAVARRLQGDQGPRPEAERRPHLVRVGVSRPHFRHKTIAFARDRGQSPTAAALAILDR